MSDACDPGPASDAGAEPPAVGTADDAVRPPPDATDATALARAPLAADEATCAAEMIGRPLRGRSAAAVRCAWGLPAVLRVDPALDDGTPFPTVFWLACPLAVTHVARLESQGVMSELTERVRAEPDLATEYADAHQRYVALRDRLGPPVPGDPSAGGMPDRVKCLHALYAHYLATGDNPVGAWVAEQVEPMACAAPCVSCGQARRDRPPSADEPGHA
jgi:hypothetical protein